MKDKIMLKQITRKELIEITQDKKIGAILGELGEKCIELSKTNDNDRDSLYLFIHNFMVNKLNEDALTGNNFSAVCFAGMVFMYIETLLLRNEIVKLMNLIELETDGKVN